LSTYRIIDQLVDGEEPRLSDLLAGVYAAKTRPLCLCREPGIAMYIAKITGQFILKRMPNSGGEHAPACDSYEPPAELSGLGQVLGSAIQESPDEGLTSLKLDFSLSKVAGRASPVSSDSEAHSAGTDGNKLSLRAMLHYLWEEAGFNRWAPAMSGKRTWYVMRKYLLQAAEGKATKGSRLPDVLYIPESFHADKKEEITQRRMAHLMKVAAPGNGVRRLMLVIGEVKEIAQSRYGYKIIFKHLPDCHFLMNVDLHKRLRKRFETELGLWDALADTHLVAVATFAVGDTGIVSLEEVALMIANDNWIPFESTFDKMLLDAMTRAGRRFIKGMRYNLPSTRPLACLVASDTWPEPTAMYILPPAASDEYAKALGDLMDESKLSRWLWKTGAAEMPPLPAVAART